MSARSVCRTFLQVEPLESRWAPATRLSTTQLFYHDLDGDPVRVTFSRPILTSNDVANDIFTFSSGNVDDSDVAQQNLWKIDLTSVPAARGIDLTVELGGLPAAGSDGMADVGLVNAGGLDLGKVIIQGDLGRILAGDDDTTTVALAKLRAASIGVKGTATQGPGGILISMVHGPVGKFVTVGSIQDALINVGSVELLKIGGSLIGGSDAIANGQFVSFGAIGAIRIGGSIIGDASAAATGSGSIFAAGPIGDVTMSGSLLGGGGTGSGSIHTGSSIGNIHIAADVFGGAGPDSGRIRTDSDVASITVLGTLGGGMGARSGVLDIRGKIGAMVIGGNVEGTGSDFSGYIGGNKIKSLLIEGNLHGGGGVGSGHVFVNKGLGSLTINGSLIGGAGLLAGRVDSEKSIGDINIEGLIFGGSIVAAGSLGNIHVGDSIVGFPTARVLLAAGGIDGPATIASLTVSGTVEYADILAGYDATSFGPPERRNADARIGSVSVGSHWIASNLIAGVDWGGDGRFGTNDDGTTVAGSSAFISKIGPITIGGILDGTAGAGDAFGIEAELVKSLSINGSVLVQASGPLNDIDALLPTNGPTFDCVLSELGA